MPYGVVSSAFSFAANTMASSSAAALPSGRASSSSITVTLTPTDDNSIRERTIGLVPGQTCKIGRSSKSEFKNMKPTRYNALFDCAVVSRNHAELRYGREVTITDKNSLHGTTVNGHRLNPGETFALAEDDVIKLGDTVSRGPDTHDGVSLIFSRVEKPAPPRHISPVGSRAFKITVPSDSDDSNMESDNESLMSVPQQRSSAKTTPEQPKMKLGTQDSPINIDAAPSKPASFINLVHDDDDDDDAYEPMVIPPKPNQFRIIPDSVGFDSQHPLTGSARTGLDQPVSDQPNSPDSVRHHNSGLTQILNDSDDFEDPPVGSDVDADDVDHDHDDMIEDEDDLAGSPAHPQIDSEADDEVEYLFEPRIDRQPSVELGVADEPVHEPTASKPRYDPVRSSQPPADVPQNAAATSQPPAKGPSTYTYGPPAFQNMFVNPATNFPSSSRWDIPPADSAVPSAFQGSTFGFTGLYPHDLSSYSSLLYPPPPTTSYGRSLGFGQSSHANTSFDAPENNVFPFSPVAEAVPEVGTSAQTSKLPVVKGKISIDDILEPTKTAESSAQTLTARAQADPVQRGSSKRKADEIEVGDMTEPAAKKTATADASTSPRQPDRTPRSPAPKRITAARVASEAARIAATLAIGSIATMAFLSSDYAGELIQRIG